MAHSKDFHRHRIHNRKIYHSESADSDEFVCEKLKKYSKKSPQKSHSLNDTFTINSNNQKRQLPKLLHKFNGKDKFFTERTHQFNFQTKRNIEKREPNFNFDPFQSVIYTVSPIKSTKNEQISTSTQTPRFAVPQRQKQSIEKYVERNLKFHQKENNDKLNFYQNNSLTYLPRIFLPRIKLYNKNMKEKELIYDQQNIYDYLKNQESHNSFDDREIRNRDHYLFSKPLEYNSDHHCHHELHYNKPDLFKQNPLFHRNFEKCYQNQNFNNCCRHNNKSCCSTDSLSSIDECIHFTNPKNDLIVNQYTKNSQNNNMTVDSQPTESIKHIQVLKSPFMWGNNNKKTKSENSETESILSENDWKMEIENDTLSDTPEPVFQPKSFDFWRNDDNFDLSDNSKSNIQEKRVRFD